MEHKSARSSERGVALVGIAVSVAVVAGAIGASMMLEQARRARVLARANADRAFSLAEAGVDAVQVLLNARAWDEDSSLDWSSDKTDNDGDGRVDEGDETLAASAILWDSDDVDNDGDGRVDEADERIARVACTATVGRSRSNLTAWLRSDMSLVPDPPGTVYVADPLAQFSFNGNSLLLSGFDRNLDGTPGPEKAIYGVAVGGSTSSVLKQLSKVQLGNLVGAGGPPSITSWTEPDADFIEHIIETFGPRAATVFTGYVGTYSGNLGDAATGDYQITLSHGDLKVGGGAHGAGILLVEGDLEISGGWEFVGLVATTGRFLMKGGGSTIRLSGAAFVGGDLVQPTAAVSGNVYLQYSSEALAFLRNAFGTYAVTAIVE